MTTWEIIPGLLWQGNLLGEVLSSDHDVVISCSRLSGLVVKPWPVHLLFPFEDTDKLPDMEYAWSVAMFGTGQVWPTPRVFESRRTLVNCNAGQNRSGLIIGMMMIQHGMRDVVTKIREKHAEALNNKTFADYLVSVGG